MRRTLIIPNQIPLKLPNGTVGVSFSGGVDSAILLYMIMHQTDLPIHLFSVVSRWLDCCELKVYSNILGHLDERFPHKQITHTIKYSDNADHMLEMLFDEPKLALYHHQTIKSFVTGLTLSPSTKQQLDSGFPHLLDEKNYKERNPDIAQPTRRGPSWYCPLANLNKQHVAQLYSEFGVEDLFQLTRSCTESQTHCGECWWCHERMWAFGKL